MKWHEKLYSFITTHLKSVLTFVFFIIYFATIYWFNRWILDCIYFREIMHNNLTILVCLLAILWLTAIFLLVLSKIYISKDMLTNDLVLVKYISEVITGIIITGLAIIVMITIKLLYFPRWWW